MRLLPPPPSRLELRLLRRLDFVSLMVPSALEELIRLMALPLTRSDEP